MLMRSHLRHCAHSAARLLGARCVAAVLAIAAVGNAVGAELDVGEGVVVKFGADSNLVVRDTVKTGAGAVFTSIKDDAAAGVTGTAAATPSTGDWRGVRLEASSAAMGVSFVDATIRYAGDAGLDIRNASPRIDFLTVTDCFRGVRASAGGSPRFDGLNLFNNAYGLEVSGSTPILTNAQIIGNRIYGVVTTTTQLVDVRGAWWGDPSGPNDPVANPNGKGDLVSPGVTYTGWLSGIPLINPQIKVTGSPSYTSQQNISLDLACRNAAEYRLAENGNFASRPFLPMSAQVPFTLSSGDGIKQVSVEYRASTGNSVTANLIGGILLDTLGPVLTITNPSAGALLTHAITIQASASDPSGVARVEFYVDDAFLGADASSPFTLFWDLTGFADGVHTIKAIAFDALGRSTVETRSVTLHKPLSNTLTVSARATIYGAGHATLHDPGALPPPGVSFSPAPGKALTLTSVSGQVGCCGAGSTQNGADGGTQFSTNVSALGGISGIRVDGRALFLVGVFLTDQEPADPAPNALNFTGTTNYSQIAPLIGQVFYIGDDLTGIGSGQQQVILVPPTATRLYLGFAEGPGFTGTPGGYGDNIGSLSATVGIEDNAISDTTGPQVGNLGLNGVALASGQTLTRSGVLSVTTTDPSGIARVEFRVDGVLVGSDSNGADGYATNLNLYQFADGPHTLLVRSFDTLNNSTDVSLSLVIALAQPNAPTITAPKNGLSTSAKQIAVAGTAEAQSQVQIYVNGNGTGSLVPVDSTGTFSTSTSLSEGANRIQAAAVNRGGTGPRSSEVLVTVDTTIPVAPTGLSASSQPSGRIRLTWLRGTDSSVAGYHVYRSTTPFSDIAGATRVNSSLVTTTSFDDLPNADGSYQYRVVAANAAGTLSPPSNAATAISDNTAPRALSIEYAPTGRVDSASGRIGRGHVGITLRVSEALLTAPFLSIAPTGGAPISIDLTRLTDTQYSGGFDIAEATPSGQAFAVFSARDLVGNRGTDMGSGTSLLIDADGPALTTILLTPAQPIRNSATDPVTLTADFVLSEVARAGQLPSFAFLLSKAGRATVPIAGVTQTGALSYRATFQLPADAGQNEVEFLSFVYSASDDLDNRSAKVLANNRFQVYQGDLPPAAIPVNLTATALPAGKVKLTWSPVDEAAGYQVYRQAPGEGALTAFQRVTGTDLTDQTAVDGTHRYTVASIRRANNQESLSAQSATAEALADATVPDAPKNLALGLTGAGITAIWLPPLAPDVVSYNVYRSRDQIITSLAGLTALKTGVRTPAYIDPSPSLDEHAYVVTALDEAGNESPISNSAYLNAALLPVNPVSVRQSANDAPVLTWTHPSSAIAGFDVYVGPDSALVKLDTSRLTVKTFTDSGYSGDERRYTVTAVDSNSVMIGRTIVLPKLAIQLSAGATVRRGIMNRLQYAVTNLGANAVTNASLHVQLGGHDHVSAPFNLAPGANTTVPVIVGGYSDLPSTATLTLTVAIAPNEGEKVEIVRTAQVQVDDGSLTLGIAAEGLTRGTAAQVRFALSNTSDVDMEVVTARGTGSQASDELRAKLLDPDGNVLSVQPVKQAVGNVITLANGTTVARIPARTTFTSDPVALPLPSSAPDRVTLVMEMDKLHYHLGQPDAVDIQGPTSRQDAQLIDTAYYGEVISISPMTSFGDRNIVINGRAVDRRTGASLPSARLLLVLRVSGFERRFDIFTDATGSFAFVFQPQATDAGVFVVSAVHPDLVERPNQGQFVINRVTLSPSQITLRSPRNFEQPVNITVAAGEGTAASNVRLVYEPQYQPLGTLPPGVHVTLATPVSLASKESKNIGFSISADNTSSDTGTIVLKLLSDEHGSEPIGSLRVDYQFSDAKPGLFPNPSFVETGAAQGDSALEQVTIENRGLAAATGVTVHLQTTGGAPAPSWISLASSGDLGTIDVGVKKTIDLAVNPTSAVGEGIYSFKLHVTGTNVPAGDINVFVSVTQSGVGNALFKASDIYTATIDPKTGARIPGLAGAQITVQNEQVVSVTASQTTDSQGETFFTGLAAGRYKFRATAPNHQEVAGRFTIKPGVTAAQDIFLDYNLVTVQWSVRETTIQDRYEITLSATFETNVPAAVVVLEPPVVNLPELKQGDVFYGEFTLTNYGLIRADNIKPTLPTSDAMVRYEFLTQIPTSLEAKQRLTIAYRAIALKSFKLGSSSGSAGETPPDGSGSGGGGTSGGGTGGGSSGGGGGSTGGGGGGTSGGGGSSGGGTNTSSPGCFSYNETIFIPYEYRCANDSLTTGSTTGRWFYTSGTTCTAGRGGGVTVGGSGGNDGGGFGGGGAGPDYTSLPGAKCMPSPACSSGRCCSGPSGRGGGNE